jgi:hypothetical protein
MHMRSEQRRHRAYRLYAHAPSIESSSTAETDAHSGVFLGEREISLNAMAMHAPVGSVTGWTAIDRQGVVNSDHQPERHRS